LRQDLSYFLDTVDLKSWADTDTAATADLLVDVAAAPMADNEAKLAELMAKMDAARVKKGEAPANRKEEVEFVPTPLPEIAPVRASRSAGDWRTDAKKLKELVDGTGGSITRAEASVVLRKVRRSLLSLSAAPSLAVSLCRCASAPLLAGRSHRNSVPS
jgi:hypothetical protein